MVACTILTIVAAAENHLLLRADKLYTVKQLCVDFCKTKQWRLLSEYFSVAVVYNIYVYVFV